MKENVRQRIRIAGLLAGLLTGGTGLGAERPDPGTILTNCAQVYALGTANAAQMQVPVKLRGVSTGPSRYSLSLTVQDETEAVVVFVKTAAERDRVPFGTLVEINGYTGSSNLFGENTPLVRADEVQVLQTAVPPVVRRATVEETVQYKYYRQWVETEGVVLQTCIQDGEFVVHLAGEEGWLADRIRNWPPGHFPTNGWGARVRVQGLNIGFVKNPARCLIGQSTNHLSILNPGRSSPFDYPSTNAAALLDARVSTPERHRIRATVVSSEDNDTVQLRDGQVVFSADLLASPEQIAGPNPQTLPVAPTPALWNGDVVDLVGSPRIENGRLRMRWSHVRVVRSSVNPEAANLSGPLPTLTNAHQVAALGLQGAQQFHHPVQIRGVITAPIVNNRWYWVQDATAGALVVPNQFDTNLLSGDVVLVEGTVEAGLFAPFVGKARLQRLGSGPLPKPGSLAISRMAAGEGHAIWTQVEGIVRDMSLEPNSLNLLLSTGVRTVRIVVEPWNRRYLPTDWMNTRVSARGVCWTEVDGLNRPAGFYLYAPGTNHLTFGERGPASVLDVPLAATAAELQRAGSNNTLTRIEGTVLAHPPGGRVFVRTDFGAVKVGVLHTMGKWRSTTRPLPRARSPQLRPGDRVELAGTAIPSDTAPMLVDAEYRRVGEGPPPAARPVDAATLASGTADGDFVSFSARVLGRELRQSESSSLEVLLLQAEQHTLEAWREVDDAPAFGELPPRATIKVSGICEVDGGPFRQTRTAKLRILRTEDLQVTGSWSPWRSREAMRVATLALAGIGAVLVWAYFLRRQVTLRTSALAAANRHLQAEITERGRREKIQQATFQISEAVHTASDLKSLYQRVHEIVGSLMPANNFFLLLRDVAADHHVYAYHVDQRDPWPKPRKVAGGLVGHILRTGLPLLADRDSMTNPRNDWHYVSGTPSAIWLGVPLMVRGETIGVMAVQDYANPKAYGEEEKQILTYVAEQTALAIERKQAEQEIVRALATERELGELKNRFVSMVSHEFRTPLGITMSAIELLRNHLDLLDDAKRKELFDDIFGSTRHMAGLMEQVLLLGRVEAGKLGYRPAPLDLAALCHKLADESLSTTNRRCPIKVEVDASLSETRADESLLRHIFSNLLSNAVKYSPEGTAVEFTARRDGRTAIFTVRDRGIGIPEVDLPKLFQAFHRATNVGDAPGTGLGLVIVKRCAELHGGTIEVESKTGEGTRFTVRVPLN